MLQAVEQTLMHPAVIERALTYAETVIAAVLDGHDHAADLASRLVRGRLKFVPLEGGN